jgi:hypothetical protein
MIANGTKSQMRELEDTSGDFSLEQFGVVITGIGVVCFIVSTFARFSRFVLLLANILFFSGIVCTLGLMKSHNLFLSQKRIPATVMLGLGLVLILFNHGFLGLIAQLAGSFVLFGGFLPIIMKRARKIPGIGEYFRFALPGFMYSMNQENNTDLPI